MEELIIYAIIIISIIVNVYRNFKKQQDENAKRVIGKPTAQQSQEKPVSTVRPVQKVEKKQVFTPSKSSLDTERPTLESDFEKYYKEKPEYTFGNYQSLETSPSGSSITFIETEGFENVVESIEEEDKKEQAGKRHPSMAYSLLEEKDALKKAVLYNAILERKY